MFELDGLDAVAVGLGGDGPVGLEEPEPARAEVRGEHGLQDGEGHARLVAEPGDVPAAGVEVPFGAGGLGERVVPPVVVPDPVAQAPVGGGDAELLDPRGLVGRDRLAGELAADPVVFLGEDDVAARSQRGERGGDATEAAADDEDLGSQFFQQWSLQRGAFLWWGCECRAVVQFARQQSLGAGLGALQERVEDLDGLESHVAPGDGEAGGVEIDRDRAGRVAESDHRQVGRDPQAPFGRPGRDGRDVGGFFEEHGGDTLGGEAVERSGLDGGHPPGGLGGSGGEAAQAVGVGLRSLAASDVGQVAVAGVEGAADRGRRGGGVVGADIGHRSPASSRRPTETKGISSSIRRARSSRSMSRPRSTQPSARRMRPPSAKMRRRPFWTGALVSSSRSLERRSAFSSMPTRKGW
ncbi:hypothetical protein GCM10029992_33470 [Glycomyces albus]